MVKSAHLIDKSIILQMKILDYICGLYLSTKYDNDTFGSLCKLQRFIIDLLLDKNITKIDLLELFWSKLQNLIDIIMKIPQVNLENYVILSLYHVSEVIYYKAD